MPVLHSKGSISSSHPVHPPTLQSLAPGSCASICWENILNWTSKTTVFLKTRTTGTKPPQQLAFKNN